VNAVTQATPKIDTVFGSHVALAMSLVPDLTGVCLLDGTLNSLGAHGDFTTAAGIKWVQSLGLLDASNRTPVARARGLACWWTAIPIEESDGSLLGVFCVSQKRQSPPTQPSVYANELNGALRPLLHCVHRDLVALKPAPEVVQILTERTMELEWLFNVTSNLKGAVDDQRIVEELLSAATKRLHSAYGVLCIPNKRMTLRSASDASSAASMNDAWVQTQPHLMTWVQRQNRPLVINRVNSATTDRVSCKVLCVPVGRESGRVMGMLAFYNPPDAADFQDRQTFLARHIGRQAASIIEAQFDLMTGLYTRAGLDQMYVSIEYAQESVEASILYVDINQIHVANELYGFEVGNELIVRVADLLTAPILPVEALAARISGDRFAIILPLTSCTDALVVAGKLQAAVRQIVIGPATDPFDVSINGGISILLPMPDGLARAIAAAEMACKTAKQRGRNRIELYNLEDGSMMRRHTDAIAVGQLRSALKSDRLLLHAQRITPLQNSRLAGGYELLLRLRDIDGKLIAPGPLIDTAQRYQLLPSIDRWVMQRALQMLAPYRGMLKSRELSISINVSGQSIGDEAFGEQLTQLLKDANLPTNCVSVELTEQAAITNLTRANQLVGRLSALGCRFALDDFGTGANSLSYLKTLQIYRVKIDGSFVRDILTNRNSRATVCAIVELAKGMGIETVAEYVETEEIAQAVKLLGVDYAQGYAYGKPEPLSDLLDDLTQDESRRLHRLYLET
jgi:diguanylate cyclase (GGDEF)-like protein